MGIRFSRSARQFWNSTKFVIYAVRNPNRQRANIFRAASRPQFDCFEKNIRGAMNAADRLHDLNALLAARLAHFQKTSEHGHQRFEPRNDAQKVAQKKVKDYLASLDYDASHTTAFSKESQ